MNFSYIKCMKRAYTDVPDAGAVVEEGVSLANLFDIAQVPQIKTVVVVHHPYLEQWVYVYMYVCVCVCVCVVTIIQILCYA